VTAPMTAEHPCRCGHPQKVHEHYTWHENCATCDCPEYRNPNAPRWITAVIVAGVLVLVAVVVGAWAVARLVVGA
jgi:hypothetical protein